MVLGSLVNFSLTVFFYFKNERIDLYVEGTRKYVHVYVDGARTYVYTYGAPRAIPRACICAVVVEWARTSSLYLLIIDH